MSFCRTHESLTIAGSSSLGSLHSAPKVDIGRASLADVAFRMRQAPVRIYSPLSDEVLPAKKVPTEEGKVRWDPEARKVAELPEEKNLVKEGMNSHAVLVSRLKSRTVRQEAEDHKAFLLEYATEGVATPHQDQRMDSLLEECMANVEKCRVNSDSLQAEAQETERQVKIASSDTVKRATDKELAGMAPFERSQVRIQEDKREAEAQRLRD